MEIIHFVLSEELVEVIIVTSKVITGNLISQVAQFKKQRSISNWASGIVNSLTAYTLKQ